VSNRPFFQTWDPRAKEAFMEGCCTTTSSGGQQHLKCHPQVEASYYRGKKQVDYHLLPSLSDLVVRVVVGQDSTHLSGHVSTTSTGGETITTTTVGFYARLVKVVVGSGSSSSKWELVVIPGATHFIPLEKPFLVAHVIHTVVFPIKTRI